MSTLINIACVQQRTPTCTRVYFKFIESQFHLRSAEEHSRHCNLLEQNDLNASDRQHYSTTFGVNRRSLLSSLKYLDVTSGMLIPDIMHDILEGALPLEVKLMLKVRLTFCMHTYIILLMFMCIRVL